MDGDGDLDLAAAAGDWGGFLLTNLSRQVHMPLEPGVGEGYPVEFYARSPQSLGWHAVLPFWSPGRAAIPLAPFGTFFLDPLRALILGPLVIPGAGGSTAGCVPLPNDPALVGRDSYYQALFIPDLAFPGLPCRLSNCAWGRVYP